MTAWLAKCMESQLPGFFQFLAKATPAEQSVGH